MKTDAGIITNDQNGKMRLLSLAALSGLLSLGYWLNPQPVHDIMNLLLARDLQASIEYIRLLGSSAALVTFAIILFINITAILPNIFILAAAGIIFGEIEGALIAWAAESAGVIISFLLMRYFFQDHAQKLITRSSILKQANDFSGANGRKVMITARCIPFIPSGLITALGAASSITLADYAVATVIGKLPSAWIEVTLGHDLASYHENMTRLTLIILLSAGAYGVYWWKNRKSRA